MSGESSWKRSLAREQLDERMKTLQWARDVEAPPRGWIKAVRYALGMSGRQLADRLGVSKQNVSRIETGEIEGSVSLKTMRRVAEALDCRFFYCLVPDTTLEDTVRERAERKARADIERINQSMRLEAQDISSEDMRKTWRQLSERLAREMPSSLWDDD